LAKAKKPNGFAVPFSAKMASLPEVLDVYKDKEGNDKIGSDIKVLVNQVELLGGLRTETGGGRLPEVATDGDALPF